MRHRSDSIVIASPEPREASAVDILVRNLEKETVDELKARAAAAGRSLQAEVKSVLEESAHYSAHKREWFERVDRLRESMDPSIQTDSVEMIREDRNR